MTLNFFKLSSNVLFNPRIVSLSSRLRELSPFIEYSISATGDELFCPESVCGTGVNFFLSDNPVLTRSKGSVNLPQGSVKLVVLCKVY